MMMLWRIQGPSTVPCHTKWYVLVLTIFPLVWACSSFLDCDCPQGHRTRILDTFNRSEGILLMQPSQVLIGAQLVLASLISKTATGSSPGSCLSQGVRPCCGNHAAHDPTRYLTVESLTVFSYLFSVLYVCLLSWTINPNGGCLSTG